VVRQYLLMVSFIQYGKNNQMEAGNMYGIDQTNQQNRIRMKV
jgi:lipid II:glycine glycyltransferase (peptidoglycan interpeptide bridge formation enzyme)